MIHPDPDKISLALRAVGEVCLGLAKLGCEPAEVATALAHMLGAVVAAVDCCEAHAAQAEDVVLEIFGETLTTHRARYAAMDKVGEAGIHHQPGHA